MLRDYALSLSLLVIALLAYTAFVVTQKPSSDSHASKGASVTQSAASTAPSAD